MKAAGGGPVDAPEAALEAVVAKEEPSTSPTRKQGSERATSTSCPPHCDHSASLPSDVIIEMKVLLRERKYRCIGGLHCNFLYVYSGNNLNLQIIKVRSQQKRCKFFAQVDRISKVKAQMRVVAKIRPTPSYESQSAVRRSAVGESNRCCCSDGAGSGSHSDVVGESPSCVSLRVMLCINKIYIYDINVMNPNTRALDVPTFVGCPQQV